MSDMSATTRAEPFRITALPGRRRRLTASRGALLCRIGLVAAGAIWPGAGAFAKCGSITHELAGRVATADGTPVVDAAVHASWAQYFGPRALQTTTAADGRFHLTVHIDTFTGRNWLTGDRCGGFTRMLDVTVEAAGFAPASRTLELTAPALQADFVLR